MPANQAAVSPAVAAESTAKAPVAWQPITPAGIARFAEASFGRVFLVEGIVALLATVAVCWFVSAAWFPQVRAAINRLPQSGHIYKGQLVLPADSAGILSESRLLGFSINPESQPTPTLASHLRIQFHDSYVAICSLFGCIHYHYPRGYIIEFNRPEVQPWWGAWEPIIIGMLALGVALGLLLSWLVLATLYFPVAWLIAFFADRRLSLAGSWRLASAALMPGALLLSLCIPAYGLHALDVIRFLILVCLHFATAWIFIVVSIFALPRIGNAPVRARNPFAAAKIL